MKVQFWGFKMVDRPYALQCREMIFQPSKCAEGWAIYLSKSGLMEQTEQDKEFWQMLEQSIYRTTGSYKLFRDSLIKRVDDWFADVAPRRTCSHRDKTGKRPESVHHTKIYHEGFIQSMKCTCEGYFYQKNIESRTESACPHIFANMIVQTIERKKPILPFDFHICPEEIINTILLIHKHHADYYEIDSYLFEKYGDRIITPFYKELVDANIVKKIYYNTDKSRNLEKLLKKDYNKK